MKYRRTVSTEILPLNSNAEEEAKLHPRLVGGFTHWSSMGQEGDTVEVVLTFDPSCPRCVELRKAKDAILAGGLSSCS